jgi:hypothetical protein
LPVLKALTTPAGEIRTRAAKKGSLVRLGKMPRPSARVKSPMLHIWAPEITAHETTVRRLSGLCGCVRTVR